MQDGMTPLILATKRKKVKVIDLLLDAGADLNQQSV